MSLIALVIIKDIRLNISAVSLLPKFLLASEKKMIEWITS